MPAHLSAVTPQSFTSFGELLRYLRERAELSQRELALQVGYHYSYMSRIEKNERIPDAAVLKAQFIPALGLEAEPVWAARLLELAASREKPLPSPPGPASDAPVIAPAEKEGPEPSALTPLPVPLTPLLGRETEVAALKEIILRRGVRLVTVIGPPGVGKTRLALAVAEQLFDQFPDGAVFVDLAPVSEVEQVMPAIAEALGLHDLTEASQATALQSALRRKDLLLVLDNFEQVVAAATQVATMLGGALKIKVLATSREALHIGGENEFPLAPLSFPVFSENAETATQKQRLQDLEAFPAIQLFIERARAVQSDFRLRMDNAADIIEICSRLDGLPLAIELAAVRIKMLTPKAMLQQFDRRFQWMTRGTRDARDPQGARQTLRGAFEWSYNLLSEPEHVLFHRLSVFVGGWSLEAAETICSSVDLPLSIIFDLLDQLSDKSLIIAEPGESETRYRFLETIREFAREKLVESGESQAIHNRHLAYFAQWAEKAEAGMRGSDQILWANRCETEHNNVRAALDWSRKDGAQRQDGLRLVAAISLFWVLRSHFVEGLKWLTLFLPDAEVSQDPQLRAKILYRAGGLSLLMADFDRAIELCNQSIALSREHDDKPLISAALCYLGDALQKKGDLASARSVLEESVELGRLISHPSQLAASLINLGAIVHMQGEHAQGRTFLEEALAIAKRIPDHWGIQYAMRALAAAYRLEQRFAEAQDFFKQALEKALFFGDRSGAGISLANLAIVTNLQEEYAASGQYAKQALRVFRAIGNEEQQPFALRMMAYAALHEGDLERARALCLESLKGNYELGHTTGVLACLVTMADIELANDHPAVTAKLCALVESQLATHSLILMEPDAKSLGYLQDSIQKQSKKKSILDAQEQGRKLTLAEALVEYI
jgi:predicted ATPase/transcriptional regulator with XRE-family HTH domain